MGRFSVHFLYLVYFEGVMAGAWRTPVSGYFSCSVFWDSGKRNMELTTVFTVPNAHLEADTDFLSLWFHQASILEAAGLFFSVFWSPLRALAASAVATHF